MPRGRRPGSPDTRAAILEIARRRFLTEGYQAVTLRSVAAEAGVDMALISYYFRSKRGLFGAAMALTVNPAEAIEQALAGDPATLPQRLLRTLIAVWDNPASGPPLLAMLRNVVQDEGHAALVREVMQREIVERVAARLDGPGAQRRAAAFGVVVAGVITTRYLVRLEPVASMTPDEIVRHVGPSLRLALNGPEPTGRTDRTPRGAAAAGRPVRG
ncbi:TetR/AcrR family transcriptional regulator [Streptomyces sp. NRRL WC-3742]|uniref:TetR/AcrR family transcriptional regulator n=1 Tax=Streptomyces sp. NRRL WC-3742 TaxID=1463934 RepID=UPI00068EC080|nr:TetR family transcriptional regulator [Streptomyces sp. NRRL WC-3742]